MSTRARSHMCTRAQRNAEQLAGEHPSIPAPALPAEQLPDVRAEFCRLVLDLAAGHAGLHSPDVERLTGALYSWGETAPASVCAAAGVPAGSTYARVARAVRRRAAEAVTLF